MYTESQLLRYVPEAGDWTVTVKDAPLGLHDALCSAPDSRDEFLLLNDSQIRIGGNTQIQIDRFDRDLMEIDVSSGVARFYNRSKEAIIRTTSPFGQVIAQPGSSFDLYVGDESLELVATSGSVDLIPRSASEKYQAAAGQASLITNGKDVIAGEGKTDPQWDAWNRERDSLWAAKAASGSNSANHLPKQLQSDSLVLDESGKWEKIYDESCKCEIEAWKPVKVEANWKPFTSGRWAEWNGDQCWVPDESFGYVTHHYGNWLYVNHSWYWAPPEAKPDAPPETASDTAPANEAETEVPWYPGRVAWIDSEDEADEVGWVPLAPDETYYTHNHWGPGSTLIAAGMAPPIYGKLAYLRQAFIISHRDFYAANNYARVNAVKVNKEILAAKFHTTGILSEKNLKPPASVSAKYSFSNVPIKEKPNPTRLSRIMQNRASADKASGVSGKMVRENLEKTSRGKPVEQPRTIAVSQPQRPPKPAQFGGPKAEAKPINASQEVTIKSPRIQKSESALQAKPLPAEPMKASEKALVPAKNQTRTKSLEAGQVKQTAKQRNQSAPLPQQSNVKEQTVVPDITARSREGAPATTAQPKTLENQSETSGHASVAPGRSRQPLPDQAPQSGVPQVQPGQAAVQPNQQAPAPTVTPGRSRQPLPGGPVASPSQVGQSNSPAGQQHYQNTQPGQRQMQSAPPQGQRQQPQMQQRQAPPPPPAKSAPPPQQDNKKK